MTTGPTRRPSPAAQERTACSTAITAPVVGPAQPRVGVPPRCGLAPAARWRCVQRVVARPAQPAGTAARSPPCRCRPSVSRRGAGVISRGAAVVAHSEGAKNDSRPYDMSNSARLPSGGPRTWVTSARVASGPIHRCGPGRQCVVGGRWRPTPVPVNADRPIAGRSRHRREACAARHRPTTPVETIAGSAPASSSRGRGQVWRRAALSQRGQPGCGASRASCRWSPSRVRSPALRPFRASTPAAFG